MFFVSNFKYYCHFHGLNTYLKLETKCAQLQISEMSLVNTYYFLEIQYLSWLLVEWNRFCCPSKTLDLALTPWQWRGSLSHPSQEKGIFRVLFRLASFWRKLGNIWHLSSDVLLASGLSVNVKLTSIHVKLRSGFQAKYNQTRSSQ